VKRFLFILALLIFSVSAEDKKVTAVNADWSVIQDTFDNNWPPKGEWKTKKFKGLIIPEYKGHAPHLNDFHIPKDAFPRMLDVASGPPAEGIFRVDHKEITRHVEFINEISFETDNNLEYLLELSGEWSLDKKFRTGDYIIHFNTGSDNWVELIINGKVFAGARGSLSVTGSNFPEKGQAIIKCSSLKTNNKGLISVMVYKAYEQFIPDPFKRALKDKWHVAANAGKSSVKGTPSFQWSPVTTKAINLSPWLPENTPALYRRYYKCDADGCDKNVYISATPGIKYVWVNGKEIDLNRRKIPDGVFKQGDNEVLYYSDSIQSGLKQNLEFTSVRPYWVKTTVETSSGSVMSGLIRGAVAKVYINGKYAGLMHQEREGEFLGMGLFKSGKNEVALCILQDNERTFLEELTFSQIGKDTPNILPWTEAGSEIGSAASGLNGNYGGLYLNFNDSRRVISTKLNLISTDSDCELIFDSGRRFPDWMFKSQLHAPREILLNGEKIARVGHSFVLPAKLLKKENEISFETLGLQIPEPLFYTSAAAKPQIFVKLQQTSAPELLKPELYFKGTKLTFTVDWDNQLFDNLSIELNGAVINRKKPQAIDEFSFTLAKDGDNELVIYGIKGDKRYKVQSRVLKTADAPADNAKWLKDNKFLKTVVISESAFYSSESTLFPGSFKNEWAKREKFSDSDKLDFGPLQSWNEDNSFKIFDSLPNGVHVIEKFGRRLETFLKLESRGRPVKFVLEYKTDEKRLWNSAAFTFQYLLWLKEKKVNVDWTLETLKDIHKSYVENRKEDAAAYVKLRKDSIVKIVKSLALRTAPGSVFEEKAK
jgi:hypothetical protein